MTLNHGLLRLLKEPHEELAYHMGCSLRGFTVKVKPESYLLVVKITKRLDGHQVAFIEAKTHLECWAYLHDSYSKSNAPLKWRQDKWA